MGTGGSIPGVKAEANHSLLSSAEIKNECSYTSTLPYIFMTLCLSTRDFTFTLQKSRKEVAKLIKVSNQAILSEKYSPIYVPFVTVK
jgi:hypothetical protein